jgi:hypothetical protein
MQKPTQEPKDKLITPIIAPSSSSNYSVSNFDDAPNRLPDYSRASDFNRVADFPRVPDDLSSIVKPEELIDIIEMSPLTLQDRRIYNLLIGNAWNDIMGKKLHEISRLELTQYVDSNNQDIAASLRRLMSAIVVVKVRNNKNGKPSMRQMQLLAENEIEERGPITYAFPEALIKIIRDTQIFARLHTKVMFQLSSKYSLALYEFLQKRKNMQYINHEILTVEEARGMLGVGNNKLLSFGHLNDKAIRPAMKEVSFLTEYEIIAEPIRTGRIVTHLKFSWEKKSDVGAQISAVEELERSRIGRKARMNQTTENLSIEHFGTEKQTLPLPPAKSLNYNNSQKSDIYISTSALEKAKELAVQAQTGWDIYAIEQQFFELAAKKGNPDNPDGAFLGFVKKKISQKP